MRALLAASVGLAVLLAGCISQSQTLDPSGLTLPRGFDTSRGWSVPLTPGLFEVLEAVKEFVPALDGVPLAVGVFLPKMDGCDWAANELPAECKLPAVMDAGPYYGPRIAQDKYRPPLIEWLVPRGYAVLQMSLRGTGESGGCLEYKSLKDIDDISAVLDWIAAQPWSNGNVGMAGRSYDGTSAWAGAASGNPHLKAIMPISGAVNAPFLYYKNGTAEGRTLQHGLTYWPPYGLGLGDGGEPTRRVQQWPEQLCREAVIDVHLESLASAATGDASSAYWQERDLQPKILDNYQGAVWTIHGLQDWNVNPSQSVPFINMLQDAGIDTKAWLGVWGHAYPDRIDEHRNVRWDWAQRVVEYFDFYLKGEGAKPSLDVEVEDSLFTWRREASYPPRDAWMFDLELSGDGTLASPGQATEGAHLLAGGTTATLGLTLNDLGAAGDSVQWRSEPLERDLRIAGLPQLMLGITPLTPKGAHLFAELYDIYPDGRSVRLGWAAMNLDYYQGGNTATQELTPGEPITAMMEFEPMDAHVGQGHALRLAVHLHGVEDIMPSPTLDGVNIRLGDGASVLRLPAVDRPTVLPSYVPPGLPEA